jgi:hypothetical protein
MDKLPEGTTAIPVDVVLFSSNIRQIGKQSDGHWYLIKTNLSMPSANRSRLRKT